MKKVLNIALIVILLGLIYHLMSKNSKLHEDLIGQTEAFQKLSEHAAKLEIQYVDQKELNSKLESKFKDELQALKGKVKLLSNATFLIREKARKSNSSDFSYQGDKVKYIVNELRYNDGPPLGYILIFDDGRVVSKIYKHAISVDTVVSKEDKTGRYSIVSKADYILNSPSINFNGEKNWFKKPFPLKINGGTAFINPVEESTTVRNFLWLPKYNFSLNATNRVSYGLTTTLMGRGVSGTDLKYRFLGVGLQYNSQDSVEATFTPVMFRPLSKLKNTYIGPTVEFGKNGLGFGLGLHLGL